jgi:periplasmic copper chaperone A
MSRRRTLLLVYAAIPALVIGLTPGVVAQEASEPEASMSAMASMDPMTEMQPGLHVLDPWTRSASTTDLPAAVYLTIHNNTDVDDALVGASSPVAAAVELHQSTADEDGAMGMLPVDQVPIPAHGDASLEPGGYHIMLVGLVEPLVEGSQIEIRLEFAAGEPQTILVPVRALAPMEDMDMGGGDMDMGGGDGE